MRPVEKGMRAVIGVEVWQLGLEFEWHRRC